MNKPRNESGDTTLKFINKRGWIIALGITTVGFLVRLSGIFEWWLNPDEGIYYSMVAWRNSAMFWTEMMSNAHPPLFYLVTRAFSWMSTDFVFIRSLSLLFGSAAVFAAWLAGREISSPERTGAVTGLLTAVIVAFSPGAIVMSQLIRPYMMQLTFLLLALYHLLRFRRQLRIANLFWYSVLLSLSILTHYSSFLALGAFGFLILRDITVGKTGRRNIYAFVAAHVAPVLICAGLYFFHLRPHLLDSALADEALNSWLAPFMIDSIGGVWLHLLGFMGFLFGPRFAGPAALIWAASLILASKRRLWPLLTLSAGAVGLAVFASAVGHYPFGACRHCSWLIGFVAIPLAWGLSQALFSRHRGKVFVTALIIVLVVAGNRVGRLVGTTRVSVRAVKEQILKKTDVANVEPLLKSGAEPGIVLISTQSYYLFTPLFVGEREVIEKSPDQSFFTFRWGKREVVVLRSWDFSARPEDLGKPDHLFTFVQNADRQMPRLQLGKQNEVLMVFGGWSHKTPKLLLLADQSLPEGARLISNKIEAPGLTAFVFDIARYRLLMKEALKRDSR